MQDVIVWLTLLAAISLGVAVRYRRVLVERARRSLSGADPADAGGEDADAAGGNADGSSVVVTPPAVRPDVDLDPHATVVPDEDADPEAYVLGLLAAHGGRMRQQWIVDARDWSETVVSQHLVRMEERGLVVRYSLGRENAVCLPEYALDEDR